ncbi:hypothetical protein [Dyadobacter tibetensis]|uniref:hypothetical protein n=1 Tax=Dyadobacter tibetensis TaxID=1211851 RepID=UPI0004703E7A|nr:hypothetical protein [Dyadobacter tibetensis]
MKKLNLFRFGILLASASLFYQCKDSSEDLKPDEENELITTVKLNFKDETAGTLKTFVFQDKDGEGGNAPTRFDTIRLAANTSYSLSMEFLDESKNPVDDITEEILEKGDEHLIVITPTPTSALTYAYTDKDEKGLPIGLKGTATTKAAAMGKLKVQLRHQAGTKDGTATPGNDDVHLDFVLDIQ